MTKKLISVVLAGIMCVMVAIPALAETVDYTYIESVCISLQYQDFKSGSTDDEGNVTITLPGAGNLYQLESSKISNMPSGGWRPGNIPNLRITLAVNNEDTTRFAYSASRPSGVSVDNGEVHLGETRSNSKKVYYEIYLNEVVDDDEKWPDETDGNNEPGPGTTGSNKGAWLQDPNNKRYWYSNANGTRTYNDWQKVDGVWYFFDATGYRVDNQWIKWKGKDYYLGMNGRMYSNERTPDGYWVNSDGSWDGKPKNS